MYCVIQKIQKKKPNPYGAAKEIKVSRTTWTINGETRTKYYYTNSSESFGRPIKDAYKISIHESYREKGIVKKRQWIICTMGYYSLIESWPGDCIIRSKLNEKLKEMDISEEKLWDMVYFKLQPIIDSAKKQFEYTEEDKTQKKHKEIINKYLEAKKFFEEKYGQDTYDYCYDVFGVLRNEEYLKQIGDNYKAQQQYKNSRYYDNNSSNYSDYDFSSYFKNQHSNYCEEDKENLKKIYKALALKFHPDIAKDDGTMMKLVNKLKAEWGI